MVFSLVVLLAVITQALAGQWALDYSSAAAIIAGVGSSVIQYVSPIFYLLIFLDPQVDGIGVAGATSNQIGTYVERYNGTAWTKTHIDGALLLDVAATPSGTVVAATVHSIFVSNDNGDSYTTVTGVGGASQSASVWGADKEYLALVGTWDDPNSKRKYIEGVAYSTDKGQTWSLSAPVPPGAPRYGAFPSDKVWYVSSGLWGASAKSERSEGKFSFSQRFDFNRGLLKSTTTDYTGWWGAVSKTTDGGKTWEQIFQTDYEKDTFYFNAISCSSETHCAVIAEGYDENGVQQAKIHVTWDGGVTWTPTLVTDDYSMVSVKFINDNDGWALGTDVIDRQDLYGQFYRTSDGGKTWELFQVSNISHHANLFILSIFFSYSSP